ncbi:alpha/beta hydrolase [Pararhodospirillum oryzae]|uniref:Alpha/beta hydrolase n=1 Tax=Pararhodospirillum oryzae TaxID=478448 RepID=A0A512H8Q9_9PROT|nr:alpha/beta fold hydrolase [Pararhodospirillum oryzae]GEO81833.1 alpha/beta hydrolase [Pararhodospirillum oryzae]
MTPPRWTAWRSVVAPRAVVALAAALMIVLALARLMAPLADLEIRHTFVDETPVTVFQPAKGPLGPAVVIAHGFAGSQQLMQNFAIALAEAGYVAVTFDALGHGRHPEPLGGDLANVDGATVYLLNQIHQVAQFARDLVPDQPRFAVLGHSMASDIVVRYAAAEPAVAATVAVSMFSPAVTPTEPRDLLVIVGALEQNALKAEALRAVAMVAGTSAPQAEATYGSIDQGTARRYVLAPGVEHIGVLFSRVAATETVAWLDAVFHRHGAGPVPARMPWIGVLLAGVVGLAWPLSTLLPRIAPPPKSAARLTGRPFFWLAVGPALATPVLLRPLPTDFLPTLVGDYLVAHAAVYGLLTAAGLAWWCRHERRAGRACPVVAFPRLERSEWGRLGLAGGLAAAYGLVAFGLPVDRFVTAVAPGPARWFLVPVMALGTVPYILADEALIRRAGNSFLRGVATRTLFLASLGLAIALDFESLFFLIILMPALVVFMGVFGLFARWTWARTHHGAVGGLATALALAIAIAAIFPVVSG